MANDRSAVRDETATDDPVVAYVSAQIQDFMNMSSAPGVAVALYHQGIEYLLCFGTCQAPGVDGLAPAPVTSDTMFAVGSVTKVFTATLLAQQVVLKSASLSESVLKYLPAEVTNANLQAVTLQDLATHTSELQDHQAVFKNPPHRSGQLFADQPPSSALIQAWSDWKNGCQTTIGTHWEYSNIGFVTLGFAVVGPDGPPNGPGYDTLLQTIITGPLGMKFTMPGSQIPSTATVAQGYAWHQHGANRIVTPVAGRATDLYSTSNDMLTWLEANLGVLESVPSTLAKALQWTHGNPEADRAPYFYGATNVDCKNRGKRLPFDMGLAWQISHAQPPVWAKDGATGAGGGSAWVAFMPAQGTGLAILTNLDGADPIPVGVNIIRNLPS